MFNITLPRIGLPCMDNCSSAKWRGEEYTWCRTGPHERDLCGLEGKASDQAQCVGELQPGGELLVVQDRYKG